MKYSILINNKKYLFNFLFKKNIKNDIIFYIKNNRKEKKYEENFNDIYDVFYFYLYC